METLYDKWPQASDLAQQSPEDISQVLLDIAAESRQYSGLFFPDAVNMIAMGYYALLPRQGLAYGVWQQAPSHPGEHYPTEQRPNIEVRLQHIWANMARDGDVVPAPTANGRNGWYMFSEEKDKELTEKAEKEQEEADKAGEDARREQREKRGQDERGKGERGREDTRRDQREQREHEGHTGQQPQQDDAQKRAVHEQERVARDGAAPKPADAAKGQPSGTPPTTKDQK